VLTDHEWRLLDDLRAAEPAQIVPYEERARTARLLREHWPA